MGGSSVTPPPVRSYPTGVLWGSSWPAVSRRLRCLPPCGHGLRSTYNPSGPNGGVGERLIAAPAYARIINLVKGPADPSFLQVHPTWGDRRPERAVGDRRGR